MNAFKKLLLAVMALMLFGSTLTPIAYADHDENDDGTVMVVEELGYDPIPALIGMRDTEEVMIRMAGVLDRYDGSGHPDDCDDFVLYMTIMSLLNFSFFIEAIFAPNEWTDVYTIAAGATETVFDTNLSIFYLCQNGRDDSISAHNLAAGRDGIETGLEELRSAIRASAERIGVDPEEIPSSIGIIIDQPIDPSEIEFIAEELGLTWDSEIFYEDLRITGAILETIGGWLDRLIADQTVGCGEYIIHMELALGPVPFLVVEDTWQPLFDEHIAIINMLFDTNKELIDVCLNGGNISEFMVFKAREGVANGVDRLHTIKQESERRLGITPQ